MDKEIITKLQKTFEDYAQEAEGIEFWFARDLQDLLGYDKWENFLKVIEKAKIACKNTGHEINDHFPEVRKMVELGSGARKDLDKSAMFPHKESFPMSSLTASAAFQSCLPHKSQQD